MNTKKKDVTRGRKLRVTKAHCAMKSDFSGNTQVIFTITVTARMFLAQNIALSAITAVFILVAVIVADPWRGW